MQKQITRASIGDKIKMWAIRHAQNAIASLGRLTRNTTSTLMTTSVIGIALALPGGLYLTIDSFRSIGDDWDSNPTISVFLDLDVSDESSKIIAKKIMDIQGVSSTKIITSEEAFQEFRMLSNFGDTLDLLGSNPLPAVIIIKPDDMHGTIDQMEKIILNVNKIPQIDLIQVDTQWVKRLNAILKIIERGIYILALLLCVAIFLIIGNTIRLEILNRSEEIKIIRLVGGSDAFVRRPFLYEGFWYGSIGAVISIGLIYLSIFLMNDPITSLIGLYDTDSNLKIATSETFILILIGSPSLGLFSSWLAVDRHLRKIQPT